LFDLAENHLSFSEQLQQCQSLGLVAVNVTHPFKEHAATVYPVLDSAMQRVGSVNTLSFHKQQAFNTDYSGFVRAFQKNLPDAPLDRVLQVGAGGVGRAVAFALGRLHAGVHIDLVDSDLNKAQRLASQLADAGIACEAHPPERMPALPLSDGVINCTPLGMVQYPGSAIPLDLLSKQTWAFDAVYTPLETTFLQAAKAAGLIVLSGYELFFYQGVDAFKHFTGYDVDETALRRALSQ
jgi:shikimate dehydrogenase